MGDGHAAQGDGELTGNALETSMEVEFTVDVISGKRVPGPRVESATHIMAVGLDGSEYKVSEVADRNAGVVLKINKERLQTLPAATVK